MTDQIESAIKCINDARCTVVFTGAGISTEAGIPDFRSKGGLWEDPELMYQLSRSGFKRDPAAFYQASLKLMPTINQAAPTAAHHLLANMETKGKLSAVITQNIDGLHRAAGSRKVYEIHGTFRTGTCIRCRQSYEMQDFFAKIAAGEIELPLCGSCDAPIKPDVVLFGDLLPFDTWQEAVEEVRECDLLIVMGSSLVVYPAADLPRLAVGNDARLIIVNREPTEFDKFATLVIREQLGDFADAIAGRIMG